MPAAAGLAYAAPSEELYNCLSGKVLEGKKINQFTDSCPLPIKFSSHGSINFYAF